MIQLTVNGVQLDLDERSAATITAHNAAFDDALVSRAYSFPFSLPASGTNLHALGHINRLDYLHQKVVYDASLRLGGGTEFTGLLELGNVRHGRIEVTFKNKGRQLADLLKDLRLRDILEVVEIPQPVVPFWTFRFEQAPTFTDNIPIGFAIRINSVDYGASVQGYTYINATQWDADIVQVGTEVAANINADYPGVATFDSATFLLSIFPTPDITDFAVSTTYAPIENLAFTPAWLTVGAARVQNFIDWMLSLYATPDTRLFFPVFYAPEFFTEKLERKNGKYNNLLNQPQALDYMYLSEADGVAYPKVPQVRVNYVLQRISEALGLGTFQLLDYTHADTALMGVFNNICIEAMAQDALSLRTPWFDWGHPDSMQMGGKLFYASKIELKQHVPDISAAEFLLALSTVFNAHLVDNTGAITLRARSEQMLSAAQDLTHQLVFDYEYQPAVSDAKLIFAVDLDDAYRPTGQLDPVGSGERVIEVAGTFADDIYQAQKRFGELRLCRTDMQGNSTLLGLRHEMKLVRFFLTCTSTTTNVQVGLPRNVFHATHYAENHNGVQFSDFALELKDTVVPGLYEKYYRAWMPVLRGMDVSLTMLIPHHRLSIVQQWINARIRLEIDMGVIEILPKEVQVSQGLNAQSEVQVEAVILR